MALFSPRTPMERSNTLSANAPKETSLSETVEGAMEIVQYHLIRNLTAYRSHRKKRVKLAKIHNINLSL
jgi:hypothetical protein